MRNVEAGTLAGREEISIAKNLVILYRVPILVAVGTWAFLLFAVQVRRAYLAFTSLRAFQEHRMSIKRTVGTMAFGVEPGFAPYRLRQARYYELAQDIGRLAAQRLEAGQPPLRLLDIGVYDGVSRRYIEVQPAAHHIEWHGVDIFPHGEDFVYKHDDWALYHIDLEHGLPSLPAEHFDVVICEQVLEHLHNVKLATADLARVLKPGGCLIVGVPIFTPGMHLIRKHVVPVWDKLVGTKKVRGHVQAFCLPSFHKLLQTTNCLRIEKSRGFRIISGGILRSLEYQRWWWRLNRRIGQVVPALCVETQVVATRLPTATSCASTTRVAA